MRLRFFFIILIVLTVTSVAMIYLHSLYLLQTRMNFIDGQLREAASALVQSKFVELSEDSIKHADDIISEELGENRIGKFFVIRDDNGNKLFESVASKLLPFIEIPRTPQRFTMESGDYSVRILNLKLPRIKDRTLQVGLVLPREIVRPGYFSNESAVFIGIILLVGMITAWFLASTLLRPIHDLANFMVTTAQRTLTTDSIAPVPQELKGKSLLFLGGRDEYFKLIDALDTLILRINRGYKMTRLWTYQMAHELKTPLAVLGVEVQGLAVKPENRERVFEQIDRLDQIMNSFLSWAELENIDSKKKIFANRVVPLVSDLCKGFESLEPHRIQLIEREDFHVLCEPEHLRQCLGNVISNALRFSQSEVVIEIVAHTIVIKDLGAGIPASVLERLGDPFNRGEAKPGIKKGQGLGLAWVSSIARHYGWKFEVNTTSGGTTISFAFPKSA